MKVPDAIKGRWRITWMEQWALDAIDLLGPAFIEFDEKGGGEFTFICVVGSMQCAYAVHDGLPSVDFTWDGADEMDPASGDGSAEVMPDGTLAGHITIHDGDESDFVAKRLAR